MKPGSYLLPVDLGSDGAIVLAGLRGVVLDLRGCELRGAPADAPLDACKGFGIVLRDCQDVTLVGGQLGGWRVCLTAERCRDLSIEDMRFEGYFAERMVSTETYADKSDELDQAASGREWLASYGAAIALIECEDVQISGCTARRGQNGALIIDTQRARLHDDDFSFMSGWGVGLQGSSGCVIAHSRLNYCVRGWSAGAYALGHGSAGLLAARSSDNLIARCSLTHSGRGAVLFGGTGNLVVRSDLSFAVAGGLLAREERGLRVIENTVRGCASAGLDARSCDNPLFAGNGVEEAVGPGLRVEGGYGAVLLRNLLHRSEVGLELARGVRGQLRDPWIEGNSFDGNDSDLLVAGAEGVSFRGNVFPSEVRELSVRGLTGRDGKALDEESLRKCLAGLGGWMPSGRLSSSRLRSPQEREAPIDLAEALELGDLEVPGSLQAVRGAQGGLDTIVLSAFGPWDHESGAPRPAGRAPGGLLADVPWEAVWFSWQGGADPRGGEANQQAWRALAATPGHTAGVRTWTSPWGDEGSAAAVRTALGTQRFGLVARTRLTLASGRYRLTVISDDGARVLLDGVALLNDWSWHPARRTAVELQLAQGEHEIQLEYFQIDGPAVLALDLVRLELDQSTARAR